MKSVDLHLALASRQGASREAVRLLGLASIQSTVADVDLQNSIGTQITDNVVPFAVHCRRMIDLVEGEGGRCGGDAPLDGLDEFAGHGPFPSRIRDAINQVVHSRTLRISFLDASNPRVPRDQWLGALQEAALLHMETDKRARLTVPVRLLINAYLEHVQAGFDKHFGPRLKQWDVWAVI